MNRNSHVLILTGALAALALPIPAKAAPSSFVGLSPIHATFGIEASEQGFFPAEGDRFGGSFATGDFNADGADDLATGIAGDDCSDSVPNCGAVMLRWGFPGYGLTSSVLFLSQSTPGSPNPAERNDRYGAALAAGDFNGDGHDDLAIGQPTFTYAAPGGVEIHYGLPGGIQWAGEHFLRPGVDGVPSPGGEFPTEFGFSLGVGDFNGDGFDDMAIGFLRDSVNFEGDPYSAGSVTVAHGGLGGFFPFDGYRITQNEPAIPDFPENLDEFGRTLAAADFNGDGYDDLAIGVPREDNTGAILVLFGSPNSLLFANHYWLGEVDLGTVGNAEDLFGQALAAGDFNNDGFADLAIGSPGRDNVNGDQGIGMITVLFGAPGSPLGGGGGFNFAARQFLWEDVVGGESSAGDHFGSALAAADFDGDGFDDIAVGTPGNSGLVTSEGLVTVLAGSPTLFFRNDAFLPSQQRIPGPNPPQAGIGFGSALASGDFDGNGFADLAIGAPFYDGAAVETGAEVVLYGSLHSDGFEENGLNFWSDWVDH